MPSHHTLYRIFVVSLLILVSSCSTNDSVSSIPVNETSSTIDELPLSPEELSAVQQLARAKTLTGDQALLALIAASQKFLAQQDYLQALWLADKTLPMVENTFPYHHHQRLSLTLIKANSLQQLGQYTKSHSLLGDIKHYAKQHNILLTADYYHLLSTHFTQQNQPSLALTAKLHAYSTSTNTEKNTTKHVTVNELWLDFQHLSQWQLALVAAEQAPYGDGWLKLTAIANKFGSKPDQLDYQVSMWQKLYKQHPAKPVANLLLNNKLSPHLSHNIAIILPLTGRQSAAGIAIQQGVIASFANNNNKTLHFIDSNTLNWYGLSNELSALNIDYVIGPLLKSNVDKYIIHTSKQAKLQQQDLFNTSSSLLDLKNNISDVGINSPAQPLTSGTLSAIEPTANNSLDINVDTPFETGLASDLSTIDNSIAINPYLANNSQSQAIATLLLNSPASKDLPPKYHVLSMRPEDEALQSAAVLSAQPFKQPIILSQDSSVSKRIASTFAKQWQAASGNAIDVIYYKNSAQMQENIKSMLGVNDSKGRINKLNTKVSSSVISKTRNRRDIDMIFFVGSAQQARLIKPYIEVNTSEFAEIIPIYASSRSHSSKAGTAISKDLQGLTFTQIPWLLKDNQDKQLAALHQQLWPKRSDSLLRLFAMGYDSLLLIDKIPLMQQAPYIQHWGQTGVLKLDSTNMLTRSLLWGSYLNNTVKTVTLR